MGRYRVVMLCCGTGIDMTREEKIAELKKKLEKIREKRQRKRERNMKTFIPPRYDDVYWEGVEWLDRYG